MPTPLDDAWEAVKKALAAIKAAKKEKKDQKDNIDIISIALGKDGLTPEQATELNQKKNAAQDAWKAAKQAEEDAKMQLAIASGQLAQQLVLDALKK